MADLLIKATFHEVWEPDGGVPGPVHRDRLVVAQFALIEVKPLDDPLVGHVCRLRQSDFVVLDRSGRYEHARDGKPADKLCARRHPYLPRYAWGYRLIRKGNVLINRSGAAV